MDFVTCHCFQCRGGKSFKDTDTLKSHIDRNIKALAVSNHPELQKHLEDCIWKTEDAIQLALHKESQQPCKLFDIGGKHPVIAF